MNGFEIWMNILVILSNIHLNRYYLRLTWVPISSTIAGGAAGVVASVVTCPLDVIKTKLQAQRRFKGHTLEGVIGTVQRISHDHGFKGFYKGLGPTILGYLPTWAIYFTVYDQVKAVLSSKRGDPDGVDWSTHMIASATAGATGASITNPLWVVKTRFMTQDKTTIPYRHTLHALQSIYRTEGMKGFYKGLIPSLVGVTHVVIQFPVYERLKLKFKYKDGGELSTSSLLACSSISKMMASISTYPHEVVRTRLQVERKAHHLPIQNRHANTSEIALIVKSILEESGFRGLYKGLSVTLLRTVPNSAMTLLAYEIIMSELTRRRVS